LPFQVLPYIGSDADVIKLFTTVIYEFS
jgi:hypothetical protein